MKYLISILARLDREVYPIPADENIEEEIKTDVEDLFYDLDGIEIDKVKVEQV